jgi:hypothetical protein
LEFNGEYNQLAEVKFENLLGLFHVSALKLLKKKRTGIEHYNANRKVDKNKLKLNERKSRKA